MATITSTQNGNWSAGSTWVGGSEPGVNDDAVVVHDVTITGATAYAKTVTVKTNGELILNDTMQFTDTAGCGLTIEDDGNFSSNGTSSTPRTIQSASGDSPTNRWAISVEDVAGTDSRTLDFEYVEFIGNKYYLGNDDNSVEFNTGTSTDPFVTRVTPPAPLPRITVHNCEGRDKSRVYRRGGEARAMSISGVAQLDSFIFDDLDAMEEADLRISLFTRHNHMPRCRLEAVQSGESVGIFASFTITVIEDV